MLRFPSPLLSALALGALLFASAPVHAQSSIKVLVNNQPITSHEIATRAKLLRLITGGKAGQEQAVEELVEEHLKLQEARNRKISISEAQVEQAFNTIAQRAKLTPEQLSTALSQQGADPDSLKDRIRAELTWGEVIRARYRATVRISDVDVTKALKKRKPGETSEQLNEYELQQIIFIVPAKTKRQGTAGRLKEAQSFRAAFKGCQGALDQAQAMKGVVVKPRFRRDETQLPKEMAAKLAKVEVGGTLAPEPSDLGVELIAVCNKRAVEGQTKASTEMRQELQNEQGQLMARRYLRDLKADAIIEYR